MSVIMSSWPLTRPRRADLNEDGAGVDAVAAGGGLGMPAEAGVHAGVPEGERLPVDADLAVLQRAYEVVGGVHQGEQVAAVLPPHEVGDRDERLQRAVARPGALPGQGGVHTPDAREVGSAVGVALMGSVYGSHYCAALPDSVDRLPAEAAEPVRDSAAAGLYVADRLGAQGAAPADGVKTAFMDGLSASLIAVAVIVLAAALGCLLRAPKIPPTSG